MCKLSFVWLQHLEMASSSGVISLFFSLSVGINMHCEFTPEFYFTNLSITDLH